MFLRGSRQPGKCGWCSLSANCCLRLSSGTCACGRSACGIWLCTGYVRRLGVCADDAGDFGNVTHPSYSPFSIHRLADKNTSQRGERRKIEYRISEIENRKSQKSINQLYFPGNPKLPLPNTQYPIPDTQLVAHNLFTPLVGILFQLGSQNQLYLFFFIRWHRRHKLFDAVVCLLFCLYIFYQNNVISMPSPGKHSFPRYILIQKKYAS